MATTRMGAAVLRSRRRSATFRLSVPAAFILRSVHQYAVIQIPQRTSLEPSVETRDRVEQVGQRACERSLVDGLLVTRVTPRVTLAVGHSTRCTNELLLKLHAPRHHSLGAEASGTWDRWRLSLYSCRGFAPRGANCWSQRSGAAWCTRKCRYLRSDPGKRPEPTCRTSMAQRHDVDWRWGNLSIERSRP